LTTSHKYLSFGEEIVKIGPVDPEIPLLNLKKKKETEGKIYSLVGNLVELAKKEKKTRNALQSLAYSPLGVAVSPPSKYL